MNRKANVVSAFFAKTWSFERKLPEPEACFAKPREMTGFFGALTDEQKKKALEYSGNENFGDTKFSKAL